MSWRDLFAAARDAGDIARHARGLPELAEALLPPLKRVVVLGTEDAPRMEADSLIRRLRSARNEAPNAAGPPLRFKRYDWSLNAV